MRVVAIVMAGLVASLGQGGAAQKSQVEVTLDVMGIPAVPEDPRHVSRSECGCASGPGLSDERRTAPLKVTLVRISPEAASVGDTVVVELLVDHVGDTPIPLAITRNPDLAPSCRRAEGDVRTSVALFSKSGHELIAVGPGLYGSTAVAATTMMLNPGERLRVRVPVTVTGMDRTGAREDPQPLPVEASFNTEWDGCRSIFERSQADLPLLVSRPR